MIYILDTEEEVPVSLNDVNDEEVIIEEDINIDSQPHPSLKPEAEWFPFTSKTEFLMYIFMNSSTHPVVRIYVN